MNRKRRIFEDVGDRRQPERVSDQVVVADAQGTERWQIRIWLLALCGLIVAMTALGGLTRLTDSGLSITEWELVSGILPPLSEAEWEAAFSKYQETPEYLIQNSQMSLEEFRPIYWWEWSHRQMGRLTGLVWTAGFAWLLITRKIARGWIVRLLGLGALGGVQGAIGWWMVSSGLSGRVVDVASYRLAIHLGLAFIILGLIFWYVLLLERTQLDLMQARRIRDPKTENLAGWIVAILILQVILGGLVAGTDAGRAFPTWPLMNGEFFPSTALDMEPMLVNFFENPSLVQFNHRIVAYALVVLSLFAWWNCRATARLETKRAFDFFAAAVILQVLAGISTALYLAPPALAMFHQLLAILVLYLAVQARFVARYPVSVIRKRSRS